MVASKLRDPKIYERPNEFDARRFLRLRDDSNNANQYVSTSNEMFAFGEYHFFFFFFLFWFGRVYQNARVHADERGVTKGHGRHACPGRFLASSELKVALAHMLLKYDWELDETDKMPKFFDNETAHMTSPMVKLMIRRRKEEINLDLDEGLNLSDIED